MTQNYFNAPKTLEELKAAYKKLVLKHHPDLGGDTETMKAINAEYEMLFKRIESGLTDDELKKNYHKLDDGYREVIEKLIMMPLIIELVGSWLWVSGQTYNYSTQLRDAGLKFSTSKKKWYWHTGNMEKKVRSSKMKYEDIKNRYGCERIDNSTNLLTA